VSVAGQLSSGCTANPFSPQGSQGLALPFGHLHPGLRGLVVLDPAVAHVHGDSSNLAGPRGEHIAGQLLPIELGLDSSPCLSQSLRLPQTTQAHPPNAKASGLGKQFDML
jgi:hypothetical protein